MTPPSSLEALLASLEQRRAHSALRQGEREYTIGELLDRTGEWVAYMQRSGIGPGTVCAAVGEFAFNTAAFLLAALVQRTTLVPLRGGTSDENDRLFAIACVDFVVDLHSGELNHQPVTVAKRESTLLSEFLSTKRPGIIAFTSGSGGEPKGVLHNFETVLKNIVRLERKGYRSLVFLLFNHMGGINTLLTVLSSPGGVAIFPEQRTAEEIAAIVERARVELMPVTPTFLALMLAARCHERYDLRSLKLISYGAEPMPQALLDRVTALFPDVRFHQTYGMSEICLPQTKSRASNSLWVKLGGEGFQFRVIDGILHVRSDFAMLGYLNAATPFREDGWMPTGDRVEEDGEWVKFLGRDSDIINVGGEKVTPLEIESVLLTADNVLDVRVRGEKDAVFGARIIADVQLVTPEEPIALRQRLRQVCLAKLARYKVPVKFNIITSPLHSGRFKKIRTGVST